MDDDEFWSYIEGLSPEEQEQAMYDFGMMGANTLPGMSGAGGYAPSLGYGEFDLGSYSQLPPPLTKKGELVPFGLDQFAKAGNALQDVGQMTVDPNLALYGGPGAFDPSAFQPTQTPIGMPLDMSDQRYLQGLANATGGGYQTYLAQKIQGGMDPGSAVAAMWKTIQDYQAGAEELTPEKAAAGKALIASLPPAMQSDALGRGLPSQSGKVGDWSTPEGRAATTDLQSIQKTAEDLFERQSKIPQVGYTDPETGLPFAGAKTEDSPLAAEYRAAGIPLPTETYEDEKWLNAPLTEEDVFGRQEREAKAQTDYRSAIGAANTARSDEYLLDKEWTDYLAAKEKGVQRGTDAINPYGLSEELLNPANKRGVDQWRAATAGPPEVVQPGLPPQLLGIKPQPGRLNEDYLDPRLPAGSQQSYREAEQLKAAEELLNTPPSIRVEEGGRVSPTYDFGGTTRENALADTLMGQLTNAIPGGRDYSVQPLSAGRVAQARNRVGTTREARNKALQEQIRQGEITSPTEVARAGAGGRAAALARLGRTPTNDNLMQRAMARNLLLNRLGGG